MVAVTDRGNAREPQAGVLFGLGGRSRPSRMARRAARSAAGVAWVGFFAVTDILDAYEVDRGTAITGAGAQSLQRLIAAILEEGGQ